MKKLAFALCALALSGAAFADTQEDLAAGKSVEQIIQSAPEGTDLASLVVEVIELDSTKVVEAVQAAIALDSSLAERIISAAVGAAPGAAQQIVDAAIAMGVDPDVAVVAAIAGGADAGAIIATAAGDTISGSEPLNRNVTVVEDPLAGASPEPTPQPSSEPTPLPSDDPTPQPTPLPSDDPTPQPTPQPSDSPDIPDPGESPVSPS
ncbi:hypothetical protein [Agaribacterium haliotis]|uniref:hypothetical protein n=1 Tax=Agaribacterium haliotis TaxID=2013869 RepID=UPI000BB58266|nr:hypothetical protein [Agaribacterium haliotis]